MYDQNLADQAADLLARLRERRPLVHHITNNVTVNDVANVTLQLGALPIMAPKAMESMNQSSVVMKTQRMVRSLMA